MRTSIRTGRCWVPPEWRDPLRLRFYQHSAFVAVAGVTNGREACEVLADHLPLLPPGEYEPANAEPVSDEASARRMARRLSRFWPPRGARELIGSGFIPRHIPAVYTWRAPGHSEQVFRVFPDGRFALVAVFRETRIESGPGQWTRQLTASRA